MNIINHWLAKCCKLLGSSSLNSKHVHQRSGLRDQNGIKYINHTAFAGEWQVDQYDQYCILMHLAISWHILAYLSWHTERVACSSVSHSELQRYPRKLCPRPWRLAHTWHKFGSYFGFPVAKRSLYVSVCLALKSSLACGQTMRSFT